MQDGGSHDAYGRGMCQPPPPPPPANVAFAAVRSAPNEACREPFSAKRAEDNGSNDCSEPRGKRLRPTHKQEVGWGPFDEDGFVLS